MYRRRRTKREIPFSFDSFLDVVANVCGIIIRLILVAWVGARSYDAVKAKQATGAAPAPAVAKSAYVEPTFSDPLEAELQKHRDELAQQQKRLLDQLRQFQMVETTNIQIGQQLASLSESQTAIDMQRGQWEKRASDSAGATNRVKLTLADLEKRSEQLAAEMRELEKLPPLTKTLKYRTPVSRPVHTEELHFELQGGRVGFIDLDAFLVEIRRGFEDKAQLLKTQWETEGTTSTVGAYRLHYLVERERGSFDIGSRPSSEGNFRYGLTGWFVEPVAANRGETAAEALAANGEFRKLADAIDVDQTVVTLWVYQDSFELYRKLRDFLHERNIEVAGRPLPMGTPIASSRSGSASRGQ
ncbi:MAG TPA: hypothetical protein VE988_10850 [Gemmataceae bacterium]|nr:hypothetical protein [Gemmataceae bacterium]